MNLKKLAAVYAILVGLSMFAIWGLFFITGSVPLLDVRPLEITFHVIAEVVTGLTLVVAGLGLLGNRGWALNVYFLGLGLLVSALVNSPGMYVETGNMLMVAVFPVSFIFSVIFIALPLVKKEACE